jgi:hypothetical protein
MAEEPGRKVAVAVDGVKRLSRRAKERLGFPESEDVADKVEHDPREEPGLSQSSAYPCRDAHTMDLDAGMKSSAGDGVGNHMDLVAAAGRFFSEPPHDVLGASDQRR